MRFTKAEAMAMAVPIDEVRSAPLPPGLLPWTDLPQLRQLIGLDADRANSGEPDRMVEEFDEHVTFRDGNKMPARIFRPTIEKPAGGLPLLVHYHGGGWVAGSYLQSSAAFRRLAKMINLVVISLPYRFAPEHKFPLPQQDAWDGLVFAANHAQSFGANLDAGFIVSGASAGGQLAAVCTQQWVQGRNQGTHQLPPITGLYLQVPWILSKQQLSPKYEEYYNSPYQKEIADAHVLNTGHISALEEFLTPDHKSEWYSPFLAKNPHAGMPKTYFQVSGQDPLRDHALIYDDALQSAGVSTRFDLYAGLFHGFPSFLPNLPQSMKYAEDQANGIRFLLELK